VKPRTVAALLLGAVTVAGPVIGAVLLLGSGQEAAPRVPAPPVASLAPGARSADDFARAACVRLRLAAQAVQADAAAATVRTELAAARALAAAALRRDGRYAALSGAVAALDEAVRADEGATAAGGLRVALRERAVLTPG